MMLWNHISHVHDTRKFEMATLHWKQGLLCDKTSSVIPFPNKPWFLRVCIENTMGKAEIARNEQFLLCTECFLPFWRTFRYFHQI